MPPGSIHVRNLRHYYILKVQIEICRHLATSISIELLLDVAYFRNLMVDSLRQFFHGRCYPVDEKAFGEFQAQGETVFVGQH